ncbi:fimbria/pilus outer membrane usher protein [Pseudomonas sp. RA_35y_Pfl2_P32]|uniref:fimbria/pilus outer membrane usher protein n=1 Tax=Pseudomonas sp. RA_35y_Pfl2_P32 TaxID=3088705 RepID=UPI0030D6D6FC
MAAEVVQFDRQVLIEHGIDPALADYFRQAPRFAMGPRSVALQVNGVPKGRVQATFDAQGELCLDPLLVEAAGVDWHSALPSLKPGHCVGGAEALPGAVVQLFPATLQVDLLIPTGALLPFGAPARNFAKGGVAGLLNYDAFILQNQFAGQRSDFRHLDTEIGANAGNWLLRSRQRYTSLPNDTRTEHLYAYASRTLEAYPVNLQLGQLNMASPLFAGESFTGLQVQPENAPGLRWDAGISARSQVEGIAYSPSRIEVRQNGVVIYTGRVPAGPFTLQELPLLSSRLDLEVTVHEQGGQQRRYTVPAATLYDADFASAPGFSFALGQVRRLAADDRQTPAFTTFSQAWDWGRDRRLTAGLMGSAHYRAMGWGLDQQWGNTLTLGVRQVLSSERAQGVQGDQWQATFGAVLAPGLSASVTAVRQSNGFRTLSDTGWNAELGRPDSRSQEQWVLALNGATARWGAWGTTYSRFVNADEPPRSRLGLSWSRMLSDRSSLSLSLEKGLGSTAGERNSTSAYLTLSLPLGGQRRVRSYLRHDSSSGVRSGVSLNESLSETLAYSAGIERQDNGLTTVSGRLNALAHYTSLDLGYSQRGTDTRSLDAGVRGGLVAHRDGLTLSPYTLRDTFGVLKAGEQAGVKLHTPQGPVWTDGFGRAIAANLPAYSKARVEVDSASLPRNAQALHGYQEVEAGRGAVPHLDFSVVSVRRVLLRTRTLDTQWLPRGVTVHDEQDQYLATVMDTGAIYVSDLRPESVLFARLADGTRCQLEFTLPETADPTQLIENVEATCRDLSVS